jgi:hypothetical protein
VAFAPIELQAQEGFLDELVGLIACAPLVSQEAAEFLDDVGDPFHFITMTREKQESMPMLQPLAFFGDAVRFCSAQASTSGLSGGN